MTLFHLIWVYYLFTSICWDRPCSGLGESRKSAVLMANSVHIDQDEISTWKTLEGALPEEYVIPPKVFTEATGMELSCKEHRVKTMRAHMDTYRTAA